MVILGGGFAGLKVAKALGKAPVQITLLDRRNHHLFQPLLYQVATAALNPGDIAYPIRAVVKDQANTRVLLAEARGIDVAARKVVLDDGELAYDFLVVATGATHSYFGHDAWSAHAPGLKSIEDALERHLAGLGVPVLYKLPLGHGKHLASIPLGVTATLDADARKLTIDEPGVRPRA